MKNRRKIQLPWILFTILLGISSAGGAFAETVQVTVSPDVGGVVHSSPEGIYCPDGACGAEFNPGEEIWLTATYASGYQFDHWEGDLTGGESAQTLVVDGPKSVTAVFIPVQNPQTLTVAATPETGGTIHSSPGEIYCPEGNCSWEFPQNVWVNLTATYASGYQFDHWEGDLTGTEAGTEIFMDTAKSVTGVFVPVQNPQTLTVAAVPEEAGHVYTDPGQVYCPGGYCGWDYPENVWVNVSVEYNSGYQFDHWEGDITGTDPNSEVFMDGPKSVTAVFVPVQNPQTLTVSVSPTGGGVVSTSPGRIYCPEGFCSWEFPENETVHVSAAYADGYQFDHWEGDLSGTGEQRILTMDGPKSVTAVFVPIEEPQMLTVQVTPREAGIVYTSPEGIYCPDGPCEWEFPRNTGVHVNAGYNEGYQFDHWEGDLSGTGEQQMVTMDGPKSVTAVFVPIEEPQTLTAQVTPREAGIVYTSPEGIYCPDGPCEWDFPRNTGVHVNAGYNDGYQFDHWEGDLSGTGEQQILTMDGPKSVTAVFVPIEEPQTLTVQVTPLEAGIVQTSPGKIHCPDGYCQWEFPRNTEVHVTAGYKDGYQFDHWEGDLSGTGHQQTVTMDGPKSVTAVFVPIEDPRTLSVEVTPLGAGIVYTSPEGIYCPGGPCEWDFPRNATVHVNAENANGYKLGRWEGDLTGSGPGQTLVMDGPKTVRAVFVPAGTFVLEGGDAVEDLNMVSITVRPVQADAVSLFGRYVGDTYGRDFRMGWYDPRIGGYVEYGPDLTLVPGRPIWFLSRDWVSVEIDGQSVSGEKPFTLPLFYNPSTGDGWNMVAPPNSREYDWNRLVVIHGGEAKGAVGSLPSDNPFISTRFWRWDGGEYVFHDPLGPTANEIYAYDPDRWLKPYEGYWVRVRQEDVSLRFPVENISRLQRRGDDAGDIDIEQRRELRRADAASVVESPPAPLGGLSDGGSGGVQGCFISTAAD